MKIVDSLENRHRAWAHSRQTAVITWYISFDYGIRQHSAWFCLWRTLSVVLGRATPRLQCLWISHSRTTTVIT